MLLDEASFLDLKLTKLWICSEILFDHVHVVVPKFLLLDSCRCYKVLKYHKVTLVSIVQNNLPV